MVDDSCGDNNELIQYGRIKVLLPLDGPNGDPKQYSSKEEMLTKANTVFADSKPNTRKSWINQVCVQQRNKEGR